MPTSRSAPRTTSSAVSPATKKPSSGSAASTATSFAASRKCNPPPQADTFSSLSLKLCWPWLMSASINISKPACSSPSSTKNSRKILTSEQKWPSQTKRQALSDPAAIQLQRRCSQNFAAARNHRGTRYHIDHVAGNGVFAEAGATVVAHRNVREWIHTENLKFFGAKITPDQKKMVESLVAPSVVYSDSLDLYLGSRHLALHYYPGHTGGDTVVGVPDAHAVFCGDLFWRKTLPNLIDASTDRWVTTLDKLATIAPDGTYVPGHGDIGNSNDVKDFRGYLVELRSSVTAAQAAGKSGTEVVDAVLPNLQTKYGTWEFFKYFAKSNIADTAKELKGEKRVPSPPKD